MARRGADYEAEVALQGQYQSLCVRGRADGYDPVRNRLEEIKTHRGDLARQPHNHRQLHWAQAKVYAWLLCQARGWRRSTSRWSTRRGQRPPDTDQRRAQRFGPATLFEVQCQRFLVWAEVQQQRLVERDRDLKALGFPYPQFRQGQRQLAETLYKAVSTGRCLMAQASTGIGKTLGTLFPLLKAMAPQQLDKVFFLTAKTPGRALALDALRQITDATPQPALRTLELIARDKACEYPANACHGESCPLARGFYDRLHAAREEAARRPLLDKAVLREVALAHQVCPYYLGQEMARWADVLVADYNYYFDAHALLHALTQANQWRVAVLVDEAHNPVERGGECTAQAWTKASWPACARANPRRGQCPRAFEPAVERLVQGATSPYQTLDRLPEDFLRTLAQCIGLIQNVWSRRLASSTRRCCSSSSRPCSSPGSLSCSTITSYST